MVSQPLLGREVELQDLYDLPQGELDLLMAKPPRSDPTLKTVRAATDAGAQQGTYWSWLGLLMPDGIAECAGKPHSGSLQ